MNGESPHSVEAEQGVLGSMLFSPGEAIAKAAAQIKTEYFFVPAHQTIYSVLLDLSNKGREIDLITFTEVLSDRNLLDAVGGAAFVTRLFNFVPSAVNVGYYIDIVREKYARRHTIKLLKAIDSLARGAVEEFATVPAVLAEHANIIARMSVTAAVDDLAVIRPRLAATLSDLRVFLQRFVIFSTDAQPIAIAFWVVQTWLIEAFEFTPYLHVVSPEKRCGKSTLLDCLSLVVRNPWPVISPSEAVLFRKIETDAPTLLLDEVDAIFSCGKDEGKESLRAILNAGFERRAKVPRCVGPDHELREFGVFCPKALAGIGRLPDTVADRCIPIHLVRRAPGESIERFRKRDAEAAITRVRETLAQCAPSEQLITELRAARPKMPTELSDRQVDICEPLVSIADFVGGDFPDTCRKSLIAVCTADEDESLGVKLLSDSRQVFDKATDDRISTKDLLEGLIGLETDAPWASWWEVDLRNGNTRGPAVKLARLLRPHGIQARPVRLANGEVARGYLRSDFEPVWDRYCSPAPGNGEKDVTTLHPDHSYL